MTVRNSLTEDKLILRRVQATTQKFTGDAAYGHLRPKLYHNHIPNKSACVPVAVATTTSTSSKY